MTCSTTPKSRLLAGVRCSLAGSTWPERLRGGWIWRLDDYAVLDLLDALGA